MSINNLPSSRKWATLRHLARYRGVSEKTARNWARAGHMPLYKIQGVPGTCVDLDEANAALDRLAEQGVIRPGYGTFGGRKVAHVVTVVSRDEEPTPREIAADLGPLTDEQVGKVAAALLAAPPPTAGGVEEISTGEVER